MGRSEVFATLETSRSAFVAVGIFSAVVNVLSLTGAVFMLEVYDRVLPSKSIPTLVGLASIAVVLFTVQALLDVIRARLLIRIGSSFHLGLTARIQQIMIERPLRWGQLADGQRPSRDLDQIRAFLIGGGPVAFFDLPWMPLYLLVCFLCHWYIGVAASTGATILAALAWLTDFKARMPVKSAASADGVRQSLGESITRNAEVISAMGLRGRVGELWFDANKAFISQQSAAQDVTSGLSAASKVFRLALQSLVLGVGAYLVIEQQATAGIIVAGSIITARAFAPVELAIAHWRAFLAARDSAARLSSALLENPGRETVLPLPAPTRQLALESVSTAPPGALQQVLSGITFSLLAGQALAIMGPSGAGKSCLARVIVGVWKSSSGRIRLDGADLSQWDSDRLGTHLGYLPQDVELFAGTVAQNICRFEAAPNPDKIYAAARAASVHDLIVNLPQGYQTEIGVRGTILSAGQRQRIGLARALYGDPFLVVLDEPNAHLDAEGEMAVSHAIERVVERGGIAIIVAHRPAVLAKVTHVLLLVAGRVMDFGPRDEIVRKHFRPGIQDTAARSPRKEGM